MTIVVAVLFAFAALGLTLFIRNSDLPKPEPVSPTQHLDERKAQIYENLRDLQFEYRLGKLSDADYQKTKQSLQQELARVLAEIDSIRPPVRAAQPKASAAAVAKAAASESRQCAHCGARFDRALKFCGECGKPMQKEARA
jgi:NADH pyrophosphatase NudC (nudix superfamily)